MTDKEYREQKARIKKVSDKWFSAMGMGWFKVDFEWARIPDDQNSATAARTNSSWQYRSATITWFLPVLANSTDEELEAIVVHEFTHVLLSPLAQTQEQTGDDDVVAHHINEYTTETVARAFQWVRLAGEETKKK